MREHLFQVQDLWTAGLGCDLGGAFLLARGLINRPAELTRLAGSFWGSNRYQALSVARNRLDAIAGVTGLLVGFALQAVGYIVTLATAHRLSTGGKEARIAAALGIAAAVTTVLCGNVLRRVRLLPLLIEMSHYTMNEERMEFPRATLLPGWLEALGREREEGEDDLAYVRRAAGVEDLIVDVPGTNEQPERRRRATEPPLPGEPV
jgi:hypothetical protein